MVITTTAVLCAVRTLQADAASVPARFTATVMISEGWPYLPQPDAFRRENPVRVNTRALSRGAVTGIIYSFSTSAQSVLCISWSSKGGASSCSCDGTGAANSPSAAPSAPPPSSSATAYGLESAQQI